MFVYKIIYWLFDTFFKTTVQIRCENIALRSQLAVFQEQLINKKIPKLLRLGICYVVPSVLCPQPSFELSVQG